MRMRIGLVSGVTRIGVMPVGRSNRKRRTLNPRPMVGDGPMLAGQSNQSTAALLNQKKVSMSGLRRYLKTRLVTHSLTGLMNQTPRPIGQIW